MTPIQDNNLEIQSGWGTHTQADGSNIGGKPPKDYGFLQGTPSDPLDTSMLLWTEGDAYADWEAYIHRPTQQNTGHLNLDFDIITDIAAVTCAQAIETDTILTISGFNYNFSMQNNYAEGGMIQIAKAGGGWIDTGFKPGPYSANKWHHISLDYIFDTARQLGSVPAIEIDGVIFAIPTNLQWVPASKSTWSDGIFNQLQLDLNGKGGKFCIRIKNINYLWF